MLLMLKTVNIMAKELYSTQMVTYMKASGKMEKEMEKEL